MTIGIFLFIVNAVGSSEPIWVTPDTELYLPITQHQVALGAAQDIFLLDRRGQRLLHYDRHGAPMAGVAGPGNSPFDLAQINKIAFANQRLFAISPFVIKVFDHKGQFLKEIKRQNGMVTLERLASGWLSFPHKYTSRSTEQVMLYDEQMRVTKEIATWPVKIIKPDRPRALGYKPDISVCLISNDKKTLFVRKPGGNEILVYHLTHNAPVRTISLGISIDVAANRKLLKAQQDSPVPYGSWFPEMIQAPDNMLYVYPNKSLDRVLVFDGDGQPGIARYTKNELKRLMATHNDAYYVSFLDRKTEAYRIAKVDRAAFSDFIQATPYSHDP